MPGNGRMVLDASNQPTVVPEEPFEASIGGRILLVGQLFARWRASGNDGKLDGLFRRRISYGKVRLEVSGRHLGLTCHCNQNPR